MKIKTEKQLKTDLPEIFHNFGEARQSGFIKVKELKEKGLPIVGTYCTYMPEEIILAAGAIPISLCSTSDETIPAAEEDLPRNLCPLIKSSYGFGKTDKCPYFYFADLVIGETTCDGKKKMYEYMSEFKPFYLMNLPNSWNSDASFDLWKDEMVRLKEKLEEFFEVEITEEDIRESIELINAERDARKNFYSLGKLNPPAITGSEMFKVMYGANYSFDKEELIETLNETTEKIRKEYEEGKVLPEKPRILMTGCPIGGVTEKVIRAIEDNGGQIVFFENCTVSKNVDKLNIEPMEDVYEELATKYSLIGCSCMSYNERRFELLDEIIDEYQVDGVLEMGLQSCHPYAVESKKIKEFCNNEKDVDYIYIETDYSESDIEQINTRVAAFIEMIEA